MISISGQGNSVRGCWVEPVILRGLVFILFPGDFAGAQSRPPGVPAEAVSFQGHWYSLYYEEIESWPEAVQACQDKGGHLVCLETAEESAFVTNYADSVTARRFWVGGYRKDDQWFWITGPAIPADEIVGRVAPATNRLNITSRNQDRLLTSVPEDPVSELKSYVCEWVPGETVALTLPGSSAVVSLPPANSRPPSSPPPTMSKSADDADARRLWTSAAGTKIEAELIDFDGQLVKLQSDQQEIRLQVNQLSPEDQLLLKDWMQNRPTAAPATTPKKVKQWPRTVEVSRTPEITVVSEDEAAGKFVYRSPNYEFSSPIQLSNSMVQELAVVFEATYALLDALPVGLNLRVGEKEPLKVVLVEDINGIIELGGSGTNEYTYLPRIDSVVVTLGNLGGEKKNGRWSMSARDANLSDIRLRIAEQLYSEITGPLLPWFDIGFGRYVAEMRYRDGRFLVSSQRSAVRDFVERQNSATTFPMPDLQSCMGMSSSEWRALIAAGELDDYYPASVLLVYYFLHLDGEGDSAHAAEYVRALASGMPQKQAQEQFLMRGRSYQELASDVDTQFRDIGVRIEILPPRG